MSHDTCGRLRPHKKDLYLHAAINDAANLSDTTPGAWIHSRLRACLDIELAQGGSAASKSRRTSLMRWAAGHAPLDVENLRSAEDICDSLAARDGVRNPGPDAARHPHAAAEFRRCHCPRRAPPGPDPDHSRRPRHTSG